MARRIRWTSSAVSDLRGIEAYIGMDSTFFARQTVDLINTKVKALSDFPFAHELHLNLIVQTCGKFGSLTTASFTR